MIAKIFSACPQGFSGYLVTIEGSAVRGLPAFNLVGMANKTINEARDRVRSAITQSGFLFPARKVTISLAPAELHKEGSHLDLPIAMTILVLSGQLKFADTSDSLFAGELALNGEIRPIRGVINLVEAARGAGLKRAFVPLDNLTQAQLVEGIQIYGVSSLAELFRLLKGETTGIAAVAERSCEAATPQSQTVYVKNTGTDAGTDGNPGQDSSAEDFGLIYGQEQAKRALLIAIAGRHNILLSGPPGTGKTTLAKSAAGLLPPLTRSEQLENTKLYGLTSSAYRLVGTRPFRAPHHTASSRAIAGGATGLPGEITLAHNGVLFLDELPEFRRDVLEALRQPLEDRQITLASARQKLTFPAHFMLIATMNPCPCGYSGDPTHECRCTPRQIQLYRGRLSGPLLDRIDLHVVMDRTKQDLARQLGQARTGRIKATEQNNCSMRKTEVERHVKNTCSDVKTTTASLRRLIARAEKLQFERWGAGRHNCDLTSAEISERITLTKEAQQLLVAANARLSLSSRAFYKVIKVARTIADLELAQQEKSGAKSEVSAEHISEALSLRRRQEDF